MENGSHADADRAPVKRIGAVRGQQHAVHAESGSRAENRADVGGIHNIFQNNKAAGSPAERLDGGEPRTFHGAEHTAGQGKACQLCEHLKRGGKKRDVRAAFQKGKRLIFQMSVLCQKRDRLTAGVQRAFDDLWAFGNKNSILWVAAV